MTAENIRAEGYYTGLLVEQGEEQMSQTGKHTYKRFKFHINDGGPPAFVTIVTRSVSRAAVDIGTEQERRLKNGQAILRCRHTRYKDQWYPDYTIESERR